MCAKGIVGVDAQGNPNWIRMTELVVDGNGLSSTVSSVQNDVVIAQSQIKQNEDSISLVVTGTGPNAKIRTAQIVAAVNQSGSSVMISADKIRLSGNTTVSGMLTVENGALRVKSNAYINGDLTLASGKEVFATNYRVGGSLRFPGSSMGSDIYISRSDVAEMIIKASVSNNVLTLTPKTGDPITFSKATTLTGAWSSGVYTVTASPQGNHISTAIDMDPNGGSWSNGTFTRNVVYNNGQNYYPTGITAHAYIYKSNINLTRGSVTPTEPSADATLLKITANGWYVLSISVHGITKTYKLQIAAS